MSDKPKPKDDSHKGNKVVVTLVGTVDKIIPEVDPAFGYTRPEKVQIAVEGAEALYQEIRIDNTLHDEEGNAVKLKLGAEVDVNIEASSEVTLPHKPRDAKELAGEKKTS
jgi:hypothetical protein